MPDDFCFHDYSSLLLQRVRDSPFTILSRFTRAGLYLCLFASCFPAFFDMLISLGENGPMIFLFKSGPNLGPRRMIPYSQIKLLGFSFQPIRSRYLDGRCCLQKTIDEA